MGGHHGDRAGAARRPGVPPGLRTGEKEIFVMSRLTVYADDAPGTTVVRTEDAVQIAEKLAPLGVRFERWNSPVELSPDDPADKILAAYKPYLDGLMGTSGAGSADVVKMRP